MRTNETYHKRYSPDDGLKSSWTPFDAPQKINIHTVIPLGITLCIYCNDLHKILKYMYQNTKQKTYWNLFIACISLPKIND